MYCDPRLRMDPVRPEHLAVALLQPDPTSSFDCLAYAEDVGIDPREKSGELLVDSGACVSVCRPEACLDLQPASKLKDLYSVDSSRLATKGGIQPSHLWEFFFRWFGVVGRANRTPRMRSSRTWPLAFCRQSRRCQQLGTWRGPLSPGRLWRRFVAVSSATWVTWLFASLLFPVALNQQSLPACPVFQQIGHLSVRSWLLFPFPLLCSLPFPFCWLCHLWVPFPRHFRCPLPLGFVVWARRRRPRWDSTLTLIEGTKPPLHALLSKW